MVVLQQVIPLRNSIGILPSAQQIQGITSQLCTGAAVVHEYHVATLPLVAVNMVLGNFSDDATVDHPMRRLTAVFLIYE